MLCSAYLTHADRCHRVYHSKRIDRRLPFHIAHAHGNMRQKQTHTHTHRYVRTCDIFLRNRSHCFTEHSSGTWCCFYVFVYRPCGTLSQRNLNEFRHAQRTTSYDTHAGRAQGWCVIYTHMSYIYIYTWSVQQQHRAEYPKRRPRSIFTHRRNRNSRHTKREKLYRAIFWANYA